MKSDILRKISLNKPSALPLPELPEFSVRDDLNTRFVQVLEQGGGKVIFAQQEKLAAIIDTLFPNRKNMATPLPELISDIDVSLQNPQDFQDIDLCVLPAKIGVAENAALYLDEQVMGHRVLPFITQHLVLVLNQKNLLGNMHEAYNRIDLSTTGFGVFIAGPSKTADIEQALVIGAQGARSLTVIIVEDS